MISATLTQGRHRVELNHDGQRLTLEGQGAAELEPVFVGGIRWHNPAQGGSYYGFDPDDPGQVLDAIRYLEANGWTARVKVTGTPSAPLPYPVPDDRDPVTHREAAWATRFELEPEDALDDELEKAEAEVPEALGAILWARQRAELVKAAGHKYIRRVPTGKARPRYRYFYAVSGGKGLGHDDEIQAGAAFKVEHEGELGHFHVLEVLDGGQVRVRHDETGHEAVISRAALADMLRREHAQALDAHTKRMARDLEAVEKHGTAAQRARLHAQAAGYEHTAHLTGEGRGGGGHWRSGADGADGEGVRILSLFSGGGGLDIGLHRAMPKAETVAVCEIDPYARRVLAREFPDAPQHEDVRELARQAKAGTLSVKPNVVIGGFPCQDLSAANVRAKGLDGERSGLYRQMRDIVEATDPDWVVYENVPLLRSRGLDVLLHDMRALGYEVTWGSVSGVAVGAPIQRDRVFVVAHRPGVAVEWHAPDEARLGRHWRENDAPPILASDPGDEDTGAEVRDTHRPTRIAQTAMAGNAVIPQVGEYLGEVLARSRPGASAPEGKLLAVHDGERWVHPTTRKPVVKFPRAGMMRGDEIHEHRHMKKDRPIASGDMVTVRNPDPNDPWWDEGGRWVDKLGIDDDQAEVLSHLGMEGADHIPREYKAALAALEARGWIKPGPDGTWDPTDFGAMLGVTIFAVSGEAMGAGPGYGHGGYQGQGGRDESMMVKVEAVDRENGLAVISRHDENGSTFVLPLDYLARPPAPVKTDWRGGFARDLREEAWNTDEDGLEHYSTRDSAHARRLRGRQLIHWVNGNVSPAHAEWLMGFPAGHLEAGKAPEDYKVQKATRRPADPLEKAGTVAQTRAAVLRRKPHPIGPPPARNRAKWPYQGTLDFQGLRIVVENKAGSVRRGVDENGRPWSIPMRVHYGEFPGTLGTDGDPVDVFVGPRRHAPFAYVVHAQDPDTRAYDECKVMLGFDSRAEALAIFRAHYDRPGYVGGVRRMSVGELRAWLEDPRNRGKKITGGSTLTR